MNIRACGFFLLFTNARGATAGLRGRRVQREAECEPVRIRTTTEASAESRFGPARRPPQISHARRSFVLAARFLQRRMRVKGSIRAIGVPPFLNERKEIRGVRVGP
jgi:hypothetical protein